MQQAAARALGAMSPQPDSLWWFFVLKVVGMLVEVGVRVTAASQPRSCPPVDIDVILPAGAGQAADVAVGRRLCVLGIHCKCHLHGAASLQRQ